MSHAICPPTPGHRRQRDPGRRARRGRRGARSSWPSRPRSVLRRPCGRRRHWCCWTWPWSSRRCAHCRCRVPGLWSSSRAHRGPDHLAPPGRDRGRARGRASRRARPGSSSGSAAVWTPTPPPTSSSSPGRSGGAGASTLAAALAQHARDAGSRAVLVDLDPLGGGLDLMLGAETATGARWDELAGITGRVDDRVLLDALPSADGLPLLSWPTDNDLEPGPSAVEPRAGRPVSPSRPRGGRWRPRG